jgi:hypothetical protein
VADYFEPGRWKNNQKAWSKDLETIIT